MGNHFVDFVLDTYRTFLPNYNNMQKLTDPMLFAALPSKEFLQTKRFSQKKTKDLKGIVKSDKNFWQCKFLINLPRFIYYLKSHNIGKAEILNIILKVLEPPIKESATKVRPKVLAVPTVRKASTTKVLTVRKASTTKVLTVRKASATKVPTVPTVRKASATKVLAVPTVQTVVETVKNPNGVMKKLRDNAKSKMLTKS
jgi:hypothetical protein